MDQKVSRESFKAYRDWQRYILKAKPELTRGCTKSTLLAYCFAMASHGTNGLGCYASDATIAKELGKGQAKLVRPYRHEALRLGWFAWAGEARGRTKVLDIAIPADDDTSTKVDVPAIAKPADTESPAEPRHDAWIDSKDDDLRYCLACEPLQGSHSIDELWVIHAKAIGVLSTPMHPSLLGCSDLPIKVLSTPTIRVPSTPLPSTSTYTK